MAAPTSVGRNKTVTAVIVKCRSRLLTIARGRGVGWRAVRRRLGIAGGGCCGGSGNAYNIHKKLNRLRNNILYTRLYTGVGIVSNEGFFF